MRLRHWGRALAVSVGVLSALLCALNADVLDSLKSGTQPETTERSLDERSAGEHAKGVSPIQFAYQPIAFEIDSCETPERHAPETMAGGVAVFDYNNDSKLDIFFTNGAEINTLRKSSPKYFN